MALALFHAGAGIAKKQEREAPQRDLPGGWLT